MTERPTIDHIGIIVDDLAKAAAAMQKFLGVTAQPVEEKPAAGIRVQVLAAANIAIELIEYTTEGESLGRATMGHKTGLNHISKRVDNIDLAIEQLSADGFRPLPGFPVEGVSGAVAFFAPEPASAVLLEIHQSPKRAGQ